MRTPNNISTYEEFLSSLNKPIPGTICHIGCPPGQVRDDLEYVIADEQGVIFRFPERDGSADTELIHWGDIIEFWGWPTVWLLRIDPHEASTRTEYRAFKNRILGRAAFALLTKAEYQEETSQNILNRKILEFENGRRSILSYGRYLLLPVRLMEEG